MLGSSLCEELCTDTQTVPNFGILLYVNFGGHDVIDHMSDFWTNLT